MKTIGAIAGIAAAFCLLTGVAIWKVIAIGAVVWICLILLVVYGDSDGSLDKRWQMWREKLK